MTDVFTDEAREVAPGFHVWRPGEDEPPAPPEERPDPAAPLPDEPQGEYSVIPSPLARKLYPHLWKEDLAKSSAKEKAEHPWLSDKEAVRVAKDHIRAGKNEGISLAEFFLVEGRAKFYTIEPESNGNGRLLAWEGDEVEVHEPVAAGPIEELLAALVHEVPAAASKEAEIAQAYKEAVANGGEAVYVDRTGNVDITVKAGGDSEKGPDTASQYRRDNPNRYF